MIALALVLAAHADDTVRLSGTLARRPPGTVRVEVLLDAADGPLLLLASADVPAGQERWEIDVPRAGPVRIRAGVDVRQDGIGEDDAQAVFPGVIELDRDHASIQLLFQE